MLFYNSRAGAGEYLSLGKGLLDLPRGGLRGLAGRTGAAAARCCGLLITKMLSDSAVIRPTAPSFQSADEADGRQ
jgi:hypothetical protein